MTDQEIENLFNSITANGNREMTKTRFSQAVRELIKEQETEIKRLNNSVNELLKNLYGEKL
jgi:Ca2+-binding EF-hand superfamily protein